MVKWTNFVTLSPARRTLSPHCALWNSASSHEYVCAAVWGVVRVNVRVIAIARMMVGVVKWTNFVTLSRTLGPYCALWNQPQVMRMYVCFCARECACASFLV